VALPVQNKTVVISAINTSGSSVTTVSDVTPNFQERGGMEVGSGVKSHVKKRESRLMYFSFFV
jgi:hypothetical protein